MNGPSPRTTTPTASVLDLIEHLEQSRRKIIVDLLLEVDGRQWERRARAFEDARPRPGDFTGRATREELSAQWRRLTKIAQACRARAQISPLDLVTEDVDQVFGEVA